MDKSAFIAQYQESANKAAAQIGTDPAGLLAQWGLETGWGKSVIPGTNNLGNIKASKSWAGPTATAKDNATKSVAAYRAYTSTDEFVEDYVGLIKRRYPKAVNQPTVEGFATALKAGGYSEDPDYVSKILASSGKAQTVTPRQIDNAIPDPDGLQARISRGVAGLFHTNLSTDYVQAQRQVAQSLSGVINEAPDALEFVGAAMAGNTTSRIVRGIEARLFGPEFQPEPGYKPPVEDLPKELDHSTLTRYLKAESPAEAASIMARYEDDNIRTRATMSRGLATGLVAGLGGEVVDPLNWVTPFAAAKALTNLRIGSEVLAASGKVYSTVASAAGENLLGGTALEAVAQGLEGRYSPQDLAISLAADTLIGGVVGALNVRGANAEHGMALQRLHSLDALAREAQAAERVQRTMGPNATPEEMRRAMDTDLFEQAKEGQNRPIADVPPQEQIRANQDAPAQLDTEGQGPVAAKFETETFVERRAKFLPGAEHESLISKYTNGQAKTLAELEALPPGLHAVGNIPYYMKPAASTASRLAKQFLGGDFRITIAPGDIEIPGTGKLANGAVIQVSDKVAMIVVNPKMSQGEMIRTAVHEVGHVIFNKNIATVSGEQRAKLVAAFDRFVAEAKSSVPNGNVARGMRYSATSGGLAPEKEFTPKLTTAYELDWDEFSAEQFVKFLEEDAATGANKLGLREDVVQMVKNAVRAALEFLRLAKRENLGVTDEYREFFNTIMSAPDVQAVRPKLTLRKPVAQLSADPAAVVNEVLTDPLAQKYGINLAPMGTPAERKQAQAMLALHKQAEEWAAMNPMDEAYTKRASNLVNSTVFGSNLASTGLLMLTSPSPLVRMLANRLVEDSSGVIRNKTATAAISKVLTNRLMMGNLVNDFGNAFDSWKIGKANNVQGLKDDMIGGHLRAEFNRAVASEIEARGVVGAKALTNDPNVKAAADVAEAALTRSANEQKRVQTLGYEALGETSVGYLPHRMNAMSVINLTNEKRAILHQALTDQFVTIEGWDMSFADTLASRYLERVSHRASGDYGSNIGGGNTSTASLVEEALRGMDLPTDVVDKHMKSFAKGAANYTKRRIKLDLNKVYPTADGEFRLLDIFETDVLNLVRSQIGRASGEVALTKFGVQGKPGLKLLRDAMEYGADGARAGNVEKEAFDQVAAEFLEEPFGNQLGKWGERALMANAAVRLGGNVFNQLGETINAVFTLGATRAFATIKSLPDMRKEIIALSKGQVVDNPWLQSVEALGGKEFGTDAYKIVMPYDNPNSAYPAYGKDSVTATDRILRGVGHAQGIISGWRWLHSAQQRGVAQQIVMKLGKYLKEGMDDIALEQMGFTKEVQAAIKADGAFTYGPDGQATGFDATKITDPDIRDATIQATHRGAAQIIQDTFIGERGKWVHDGWMRLLTQFRGFSIVSMEKQWGRSRNNHGTYAAFGMLAGAMSMAVPLHMARVYAASVGRPDSEEYIEKNTSMQHIARSTLNYVAASGLSGDFADLLSAVAPEEFGLAPTGGRTGTESTFVGNYVAPASSLVDDIFKYAQSPTNIDELARITPFSRVPYLLPFVNTTRE